MNFKRSKNWQKFFFLWTKETLMNWDNQLPGSSCGSYHPLYELFRAKKVEHFLHTFTLVAWPFQMQYSSKSWHILQDMTYFGIFF